MQVNEIDCFCPFKKLQTIHLLSLTLEALQYPEFHIHRSTEIANHQQPEVWVQSPLADILNMATRDLLLYIDSSFSISHDSPPRTGEHTPVKLEG